MVNIVSPKMFFLLLGLVPVFVIMYRKYGYTKNKLLKIYTEDLLNKTTFHKIFVFKVIFVSMTYVSLVVGFSNPEFLLELKSDTNDQQQHTENMVFLIDVSRSMALQDSSTKNNTRNTRTNNTPQSRIESITAYLRDIVAQNNSSAYLGYIFTDRLMYVLPETYDRDFVISFLNQIEHNANVVGSSDLAKAIELFETALPEIVNEKWLSNATLFIGTDGETHTRTNGSLFKNLSTVFGNIVVISAGSEEGTTVRIDGDLVFEDGVAVISKADHALLENIAKYENTFHINLESHTKLPSSNIILGKKIHTSIAWMAWLGASLSSIGYIATIFL